MVEFLNVDAICEQVNRLVKGVRKKVLGGQLIQRDLVLEDIVLVLRIN